MERKRLFPGIGAAAGMLVLILDGKTALLGAKAGLELALYTVVPALFPFFFLSQLMTGALLGTRSLLLSPIGRLFGIPKGTEALLVTGFLGGYPAGAQSVHAAFEAGQLPGEDANRMLSFCSNAGPSFLFGMAAPMFPNALYAWALWAIHIGGAFFASLFFSCETKHISTSGRGNISLSLALKKAITVMSTVCGWVILFRVLIAFLERWFLWLLPMTAQVAVRGMLELSNGICSLPAVADVRLRFLLCSLMLSIGGLCVTMQTASVIQGLSLTHYLMGKGLQTAFSVAICLLFLYSNPLPLAVLGLLSLFLPRKSKKAVAKSSRLMYNEIR